MRVSGFSLGLILIGFGLDRVWIRGFRCSDSGCMSPSLCKRVPEVVLLLLLLLLLGARRVSMGGA